MSSYKNYLNHTQNNICEEKEKKCIYCNKTFVNNLVNNVSGTLNLIKKRKYIFYTSGNTSFSGFGKTDTFNPFGRFNEFMEIISCEKP